MRLTDHIPTAEQLAAERASVARLMASGKLGERIVAAARAAAAMHLAHEMNTRGTLRIVPASAPERRA